MYMISEKKKEALHTKKRIEGSEGRGDGKGDSDTRAFSETRGP
jgi:hypothetical protein